MHLTLHVQLLGDFRLVYGDTPVTDVTTGRLQSLLAYLLLHHGATQPRQHLAFLFWPDSTEAQARNNLRQALHQLRHALPDAEHYLYADTTTLWWRADAPFSLDVADFTRALATADDAARTADQAAMRRALEHAASLYQGDLLPSCYDDWLLPERERLHQQCQAALERLIGILEQQREYADGDPLRPAAAPARPAPRRHLPLPDAPARAEQRSRRRAARLPLVCHAAGARARRGAQPGDLCGLYAPGVRRCCRRHGPAALPTGTVTFLFTDIEGARGCGSGIPTPCRMRSPATRPSCARPSNAIMARSSARLGMPSARPSPMPRTGCTPHWTPSARSTQSRGTCSTPAQLPAPSLIPIVLRVRMALHTGVVETRAGDYVGHALNRLARILATGHGGQTLLSQATQETRAGCATARRGAAYRGAHRLKDLTRPEPICQVVVPDLPADFPAAAVARRPARHPACRTHSATGHWSRRRRWWGANPSGSSSRRHGSAPPADRRTWRW